MTIGFIPGVVIGALVYVVIDNEDRKRRLIVLGWSFLLASLVTGAWLFPNRNEVFGYLLNYGYGNHAAEYGPSTSKFGWDAWLTQARIFIAYIYLPHAIFALVGVLALLSLVAQRFMTEGHGAARSILASNVTPLVIFIAEAIVALTSTQNKGSAFLAPFLPAAFVLAVWACGQVLQFVYSRRVVMTLAVVVALFGAIPSVDAKLSHFWAVNVPVLGWATVTDGRGTIQLYEAAGGFGVEDRLDRSRGLQGQAWVDISRVTALKLGNTVAHGLRLPLASGIFSTTRIRSV